MTIARQSASSVSKSFLRCHHPQQAFSARRCLNTHSSDFPSRLAFAFDIDGVLKQGHNVLPQAKRVLSLLSNVNGRFPRPIPYLMITNGGGVTEVERRAALSRDFGVDIGDNQLVQSHTPLRDYVAKYAHQPVLIVGGFGDAGRKIAESYGMKEAYILQDLIAWNPSIWDRYTLNEDEEKFVKRNVDFSKIAFKAVFVIHDHGMDWGLATQVVTEVMASKKGVLGTRRERIGDEVEVPLILTNPDVIWGSDYPLPRLGMGAFRLALDAVYKATTGAALPYHQIGKPYESTYTFADNMLRNHLIQASEDPDKRLNVYMVGDNPESDIAGANAFGWESLLVKTGVYQTGEPKHRPTKIVADVEEGVKWAIERELSRQ